MPEASKTLVVGAAGRFAGLVVPELAKRSVPPRGLVRTPEQAEMARNNGAGEIVFGDLRNRASIEAALKGVERAFYISPVYQEDEAEIGVSSWKPLSRPVCAGSCSQRLFIPLSICGITHRSGRFRMLCSSRGWTIPCSGRQSSIRIWPRDGRPLSILEPWHNRSPPLLALHGSITAISPK